MEVGFSKGIFVCKSTFEDRAIPRDAGFRWDFAKKRWYTDSPKVAAKLEQYLNSEAKKEVEKILLIIQPWERELVVPSHKKLYQFQRKACEFALSRNRSYLALDPGLGKTPIAAVIAGTLSLINNPSPIEVVYICPPFLMKNVMNEFAKWAKDLKIWIIPDSILVRDQTLIIDQMKKFNMFKLLIVDEANRFKNDTAKRTKALFGINGRSGIASVFDKVIYMCGTVMPNRPIELFPVLNHSAPQLIDFANKFEYGKKYCDAHQTQFGWDFSGALNIGELHSNIMGSFMHRVRKKDALDLPDKIEEMVILNENLPPRLTKLSKAILNKMSPEDLMKGQIRAQLETETLYLSTYRKELGILKVPQVLEFIEYLLEETDESIIVFAIHKEVIARLIEGLSKYCPLVITGDTRVELRQEHVNQFQKDKRRRLIIGNIQAMGIGFTLTKATRVVFAEFSWTSSDNEQASDRAHRISQKNEVLVHYLVYENSVDKAVIETALRKRKLNDQLDGVTL